VTIFGAHHIYEERFKGERANDSIGTDFILEKLSKDKNSAVQMYRVLVDMNEATNRESDFEKTKEVLNLPESSNGVITHNQTARSRISLNEIISTMRFDSETTELMRSGSKKRNIAEHRVKFAEEAAKNMYTQKEIGDFLKVSQGTVSSMLSRSK
jgi:hypothetical protein